MQKYHINPDGSRSRIFDALYHQTGLDKDLRLNINDEIERVKEGEASIIIVDGGLGSGKTNTAVTIARMVQPDFNFKKQVGRGIEQFSKAWEETQKTKSISPVRVCVFDEAHTYNKRGFMTKLNKMMNEFFMTFRHTKIMLIFALPHFSVLDNSIYDTDSVRGLVHMREKHKSYADVFCYDGIAVQDMLDFIDKNSRNGKRAAKRNCYKSVFFAGGQVRLPKDHNDIDTASNIGKQAIINSSLSAASKE